MAETRAQALALFAEALAKAAPLGPVVALAAQHIDDLAGYAADVNSLTSRPAPAAVRWVVVDAVHASMGSSEGWQLIVQATIEPTDRDELRHMLADLARAAVRLSPEPQTKEFAQWFRQVKIIEGNRIYEPTAALARRQ